MVARWVSRSYKGRHKAQETVCFQNMLKIENSLKTLWICSQDQSIYLSLAKIYHIVNEVNRCLVIIIPGIIRPSVRSINSLNSHNGLNTEFMIQYIEIISAGCPFVTIAAIFSARDSSPDSWPRPGHNHKSRVTRVTNAGGAQEQRWEHNIKYLYLSPPRPKISRLVTINVSVFTTRCSLLTVSLILSKSWKSRWCWCDHWSGPGPRPEISSVSEPIWTIITQLADEKPFKSVLSPC